MSECPNCHKEVKNPIRKMSGWLCEHCRYVLPWEWFQSAKAAAQLA